MHLNIKITYVLSRPAVSTSVMARRHSASRSRARDGASMQNRSCIDEVTRLPVRESPASILSSATVRLTRSRVLSVLICRFLTLSKKKQELSLSKSCATVTSFRRLVQIDVTTRTSAENRLQNTTGLCNLPYFTNRRSSLTIHDSPGSFVLHEDIQGQ